MVGVHRVVSLAIASPKRVGGFVDTIAATTDEGSAIHAMSKYGTPSPQAKGLLTSYRCRRDLSLLSLSCCLTMRLSKRIMGSHLKDCLCSCFVGLVACEGSSSNACIGLLGGVRSTSSAPGLSSAS